MLHESFCARCMGSSEISYVNNEERTLIPRKSRRISCYGTANDQDKRMLRYFGQLALRVGIVAEPQDIILDTAIDRKLFS